MIPLSKLIEVKTLGGRQGRELYRRVAMVWLSKEDIIAGRNLDVRTENDCTSKFKVAYDDWRKIHFLRKFENVDSLRKSMSLFIQ